MIIKRALAMLSIGLAFLVPVSLAQPAVAAADRLDPTFGTGGKVLTSPSPPGVQIQPGTGKAALQPNGDIGVSGDFGLVRYLPDGSAAPPSSRKQTRSRR